MSILYKRGDRFMNNNNYEKLLSNVVKNFKSRKNFLKIERSYGFRLSGYGL